MKKSLTDKVFVFRDGEAVLVERGEVPWSAGQKLGLKYFGSTPKPIESVPAQSPAPSVDPRGEYSDKVYFEALKENRRLNKEKAKLDGEEKERQTREERKNDGRNALWKKQVDELIRGVGPVRYVKLLGEMVTNGLLSYDKGYSIEVDGKPLYMVDGKPVYFAASKFAVRVANILTRKFSGSLKGMSDRIRVLEKIAEDK